MTGYCPDCGNQQCICDEGSMNTKSVMKRLAHQDPTQIIRENMELRRQLEVVTEALKACSPAWLPSGIRDKRREALKQLKTKKNIP